MVKVFVSEWSRRAAHNLDMRRDEWVSVNSPSDFVEHELQEIKVDPRLDHAAIIAGPYPEVMTLHFKAVNDVHVLQSYIAKMNRTQQIDGKKYAKPAFDMFKLRLVKQLAYKQLLSTITRETARYRRIVASEDLSADAKAGVVGLSDADLLDRLQDLFRVQMREARGKDWFSSLSENDQVLMQYIQSRARKHRLSKP